MSPLDGEVGSPLDGEVRSPLDGKVGSPFDGESCLHWMEVYRSIVGLLAVVFDR